MKKLFVTLAAVLVSVSTFAQGTVNFNNFVGTQANPTVNAPILAPGGVAGAGSVGAVAQLFLVTGTGASATYTPLGVTSGFRNATAGNPMLNAYITGNNSMILDGQAPGSTINVIMRAWVGASYDAATVRGQSNDGTPISITLGGVTDPTLPAEFPAVLAGLQGFTLVPEPSTIALGILGAAALLYRRRK
jgi:hypothetical protein